MKTKKILSLILTIFLLTGLISLPVFSETTKITTYITVSKYNEIVNDKNGNPIALKKIELTGKDSYSLNDVFSELHDICFSGGAEDGYSTSTSEYGMYITKFWGDVSGNFGYQVNGGSESVYGPDHEISNDDYIDVSIYQNYYPATENYTTFDKYTKVISTNKPVSLTLKQADYDEFFNTVFSPCQNASITINGTTTEIITDENGNAELIFDTPGKYIISAKKSKLLGESTVPAITSPICLIEVYPPEILATHNIANKYSDDSILNDSNFLWFVADLADYKKAFNNTELLSQTQKQKYLDKIIAFSENAVSPGDLSKAILAIRSLGYDAKNITTSTFQSIDIVNKLTLLVDEGAASVTNIYTLPYVIIALNQGENYATQEQMEFLINSAISSKDSWYDTQFGTDAMTPMILALSRYYYTDTAVKEVIDEAIEILKNSQTEDGLIGNAASTGLSIAAFSSLGIDVCTIINNQLTLIDGLISQATEDLDGFNPTNFTFSTEQGFRGLISWQLEKQNKIIYDFKDNPMTPANATWYENCPVSFNITPIDATLTVNGQTSIIGNNFDLSEGTYTYTVSKSGYVAHSGEFTITAEDVSNHSLKSVNVSLNKSNPSSSSVSSSSQKTITVTLKVMTHDIDECDNSYTYRENSKDYTAIVDKSIKVDKGTSVYEILTKVLTDNQIPYTEKNQGYISSIGDFEEFGHGNNSGWLFTVNGKKVNTGSIDTIINSNSTIVWFYTDDYIKEEETSNKNNNIDTSITAENKSEETEEIVSDNETTSASTDMIFDDISESAWYYDSVKYVYENNLMNGTDNGFEPDSKMTRAMIVTVLYRFENPEKPTGTILFNDISKDMWYTDAVLWATQNEIADGVGNSLFSPDSFVTREQLCVILWRYASGKVTLNEENDSLLNFTDKSDISDWAVDAMNWAVSENIINGTGENKLSPKSLATRAEIATIFMRFANITK